MSVLVENDHGFGPVSVLDFKTSFPKFTILAVIFIHLWAPAN